MTAADDDAAITATVDGAIYAVLVEQVTEAYAMLVEAVEAGRTMDVMSKLVGTAAGLVQQIAKASGDDPAEVWGRFIRSRT